MTLSVVTISIMVALSLGLFRGMLTIMSALRSVTAEMGGLRGETAGLAADLRSEMSSLAADLRSEMSGLRHETRDELHAVRLEMRDLRDETREELRRFGERLTAHEQTGS